ncbi:unnamed protein product [Triticum turgidum subsp. durum]|uniref:RING-type domain-containing protein n=1 Tax=Triticum turgidum subsp. durum TaxID=4567 RepID=A0A9R0XZ40_TRITD|nr:unnamed protein product [Triticum turgidum subsp. durum]
MGNRIGGRRKAGVEERYTRPQGLYEHRDIDQKKLRKLILEAKLAPCYPGADDAAGGDLEECPICFLYYPSLNRSKCCSKGICTECFLQMKPTHTARPTQCPFCKTPNYAVEYRGVKTKEERSIEQFEEQKVIEAQMRVRQQALQDEEDKMKRKQSRCSSSRTIAPTTEVEYRDICSTSYSVPSYQCTQQETECCSSEPSCSAQANMRSFHSRHTRYVVLCFMFHHTLPKLILLDKFILARKSICHSYQLFQKAIYYTLDDSYSKSREYLKHKVLAIGLNVDNND